MAENSAETPANLILFPPRKDWLAKADPEPILEPDLPIVDPHHHMWEIPGFWRYLFEDLREDFNSGHNLVATVFIEAHAMWRAEGPDHLKALGETEFVNGVAAMSASGLFGPTKFCAGIVGNADLRMGSAVREVLEAHVAVAGGPNGRFRGIRQNNPWVDDPYYGSLQNPSPGLLLDSKFREGAKELVKLNLSLDTWLYHTQMSDVADLAKAMPDLAIIVNHVGAPLRSGKFARDQAQSFADWKKAMEALKPYPNVYMKVGGLGIRFCGFDFHNMPKPPTSQQMADTWKPYVETCVDVFGTKRCMLESDFPVEKDSASYAALWNAFKRLTAKASASEKADLYSGTAARVYRLKL